MIYYLFLIIVFVQFLSMIETIQMKINTELINEQEGEGYYIAQFKIPDLAAYSYFVQSQNEAYIVDPPLDIQTFKDKAQQRNTTIKYILLTHYHEDYLSGHTQIQVPVIMGEHSKRQARNFQLKQYKDGQSFDMGKLKTTVIYTPGHTIQSSSFYLQTTNNEDICIFTGDTVFIGQVGRPNINLKKDSIQNLTRQLYDSLQKLKKLNENVKIYPGHGSGSICGKSIKTGDFTTLKEQIHTNYAFLIQDRSQFIQKISKNLVQNPSYYEKISELNQKGMTISFQDIKQNCRAPKKIQQLKHLISSNYTILDTRPQAQLTGLIKGSYWLPASGMLQNWLPMILNPQDPYLLICDNGSQSQLLKKNIYLGYINCKGYNHFNMKQYDGDLQYPVIRDFRSMGDSQKKQYVDVRNQDQWQKTGVILGARLISLKNINNNNEEQLKELKRMEKQHTLIVVHCKSGLRSKFAASMLLRHGIHPLVLQQDIDNFRKLGFKMVSPKQNQEYLQKLANNSQQIENIQEVQNKAQKQSQSDNSNIMKVLQCYDQCLKNPSKSKQQCAKQCNINNQQTSSPSSSPSPQTNQMKHSLNKNQKQAARSTIIQNPSKVKQQTQKQLTAPQSKQQFALKQRLNKMFDTVFERNYQIALNQISELIKENPESSQLYANRSVCFLLLGNRENAMKDLEDAIKYNHLNPLAYFNMASLLILDDHQSKQGQNKNKVEALRNLYSSLSCMYFMKGQKSQSLNDFGKATEYAPNNIQALMLRSMKLFQTNNFTQSLFELKKVNFLTGYKKNTIQKLLSNLEKKIQQILGKQRTQMNPQVARQKQNIDKTVPQQFIIDESNPKLLGKQFKTNEESTDLIEKQIQERTIEWNQLFKQLYPQHFDKDKKQVSIKLQEDKSRESHKNKVVII